MKKTTEITYSTGTPLLLQMFCTSILLSIGCQVNAQTSIQGNIMDLLNTEVGNLSAISNDAYSEPSESDLTTWQQILEKTTTQDFTGIDGLLTNVQYELLEVTDQTQTNERVFFLLRKTLDGTNFWGTYCLHPASACETSLVIQSPHPIRDSNTGNQGVWLYNHLSAYAFFLSGTDRCNSTVSSGCSGTTSVCAKSSEAYRISDVAHNVNSIFQKSTEILFGQENAPVFLQLHGFSKNESDPYVILSNGTKSSSTIDHVFNFRQELSKTDPELTFQVGHINPNWTRLLGTTNTQGRYINSSTDPCIESAESSTGRFIHLEQEFSKLREDQDGWTKVLRGAALAFGCSTDIITGLTQNSALSLVPNPFEQKIRIEGVTPGGTFILRNLAGNTL